MRIAYITPGCGVSGGIAVICQHVTRLQKRGHEVYLLSLEKPSSMDWFPNQTVPVIHIEDWNGLLDILVATSWNTVYYLPRIPATVRCYFVQSDETRFFPANSVWKHLASLTYYFGANYLTEARWIKQWLYENFGHTAEVIPNGLDETIFYPAPPLEPRGSLPRILLEGAIALPYKGMAQAFETVDPLDVEVWCVSSLGAPQRGWKCDRFFEQVPMVEMRHIYSSCDILLKLSRVEGFFGPPMEMMACGGVAVVGKVTGYDEYIVDGYNALVVDVDDIKGARAAVTRVITDASLQNSLITNGRTTAAKWRWEDSIELLERHFKKLLSTPQHRANYAKRAEYDSSLSVAYGLLLKHGDVHQDFAAQDTNTYIPPYALTFAQYLLSKPLFWKLSAIVRWLYRCRRKVLRSIHINRIIRPPG